MMRTRTKQYFVILWMILNFQTLGLKSPEVQAEVILTAKEAATYRLFRRHGAAAAAGHAGGGGRSGGGGGKSGGESSAGTKGSEGAAAGAAAGAVAGAVVGGAAVLGGVAVAHGPAEAPPPPTVPPAPAPAPSPSPSPSPPPAPPKGWQAPTGAFNTGSVHIPDDQLKADPPKIAQNDPKDAQINSPLNYQGAFIYKKNPCELYNEGSGSHKNRKRGKGCRKAAGRFMKKAVEVPSSRCPDPGEGRCFAYENMRGRCTLLVNVGDPKKIHFELINKC